MMITTTHTLLSDMKRRELCNEIIRKIGFEYFFQGSVRVFRFSKWFSDYLRYETPHTFRFNSNTKNYLVFVFVQQKNGYNLCGVAPLEKNMNFEEQKNIMCRVLSSFNALNAFPLES